MTIQEGKNITALTIKEKDADDVENRSPRFSVIICTYNRRNAILATLACLRHQTLTYRDFEVIVVDNGSQDDTLRAVRAYVETQDQNHQRQALEGQWRVRCLSEPKSGLAYARNAGLLAATGEVVVFVDDDTLIDPRMLEQLWRAYEETGADAIGMRVIVHWDATCPHWMIAGLLDTLGHFSPSSRRLQLTFGDTFASCGFSVKREVLHAIDYFSPLLGTRSHLPASTEVEGLCQRLHQAGYALWYEPAALILHRATSARLHPAFFISRAYWQGRSDVMRNSFHLHRERALDTWHDALSELSNFARCLLVQTPLIHLAGRPTTERLLAAMEQSHAWGRFVQCLRYLERIPPIVDRPAVLFIHDTAPDDTFHYLMNSLDKLEVHYLARQLEIPLGWLWRHRSYRGQPTGILHIHQPGALELTSSQRRSFCLRLWLARRWGVQIVVTDSGGWWQSAHSRKSRERRAFERHVFRESHVLLATTQQLNLLYRDRSCRKHARYIAQPGFRGCYPPALPYEEAYQNLGIKPTTTFVYLCFAHLHIERELLFLLETFHMLTHGNRHSESLPHVQFLLVGYPADGEPSQRLLKLIESDPAVHFHTSAYRLDDIPQYMGACDALVLPHLGVHSSGSLESASIALSYERLIIAPDLPRFRGTLPHGASVPYVPASRESLSEALIKAQKITCALRTEERAALDFHQSWGDYARSLLQIYRELLGQALA